MANANMESLIDEIYEAAAVPELWPRVLGHLSVIPDAVGGILFATDLQNTKGGRIGRHCAAV
jgi:hypothetical protein